MARLGRVDLNGPSIAQVWLTITPATSNICPGPRIEVARLGRVDLKDPYTMRH